ncbi:hypothetical protein TVAG_064530 [Trichomonas vaginalis G3]|uniref:DUF3447 domain-containing protein n=1 Tax=Trichomonas vaginalis (strain ATCC PRA-98 / G3) TaxID=412133 RepID=A2EHC8_TRIV3|nr:protein kinase protein [Trichomonas vaginalis G3]EAY07906.1 hypothetical protein TVAG_064530 [Trichomonas vaginalis G3]KAI5531218.1 protein kinase protein [Trichomonas vaginalis G3]|eukprot:XP_001320129.1 hypothetical protein [Trichomonas vaginalis G3]
MSEQDIHPNRFGELRSTYKYYIDSYNALYQLKTEKEEELISIYEMIKTNLIDSKKVLPKNIMGDILKIIPYNNRYTKSYLSLAKRISDDYQVKDVKRSSIISNFLFYKEYGIKLGKSDEFEKIKSQNFEIHSEDTIYRAIMYNDKERFIAFTERNGFNEDQKLKSDLYPDAYSKEGYSLLELCCYHGAIDCFKFLRTKFNSKITERCLHFSFLGGNPEIMSECLKYRRPYNKCMEYAIISNNIDFVTFLMNEYDIEMYLGNCVKFNNLESFLVITSLNFNIPSLCEYFLSNGADVNEKSQDGFDSAPIHYAVWNNSIEEAEILISHSANINEKNDDGNTALHIAVEENCKEIINVLISHGANINEKNNVGETALHYAARRNNKEIIEFLISQGANINEKTRMEVPLFILPHFITVKKQLNFLFHMAQISMKKINMGKPLYIRLYLVIV